MSSGEPFIPKQMNVLLLSKYGEPPVVKSIETPAPKKGEILIKIDSSPVNPSDWTFLRGLYGSPKVLPVVPGFEGSGTVIATGRDLMSRRLLNKKVACFAPPDSHGTWAEYMVTSSKLAIPLKKQIDLEHASMFFVNPLTALAMTQIAKKRKTAIANTAAAGALGQILNKMCQERGIPLVNIVRRVDQKSLLQSQGAKYVLNSSADNYSNELKEQLKKLNVRIAFDAISGESAQTLLECLPKNGEVIIYGALSEARFSADPRNMTFQNKKVSGFMLSRWIKNQKMLKLLGDLKYVERFIYQSHQTTIKESVSLANTYSSLQKYLENMTAGKVIVKPWKK